MRYQGVKYIDLLRMRERNFRYFTEEESLEAVREDGSNLEYVKYQTPEICLEAVKNYGYALVYVIEQTEEICLEAYRENIYSRLYIRIDIKNEELRKLIEDDYIYYTEEASLEAVRKDGWNLQHVKYQTPEICLEAVRYNGCLLRYIREQTEEMCIEAYKDDPLSIQYIRDSLETYRKRKLDQISDIL